MRKKARDSASSIGNGLSERIAIMNVESEEEEKKKKRKKKKG